MSVLVILILISALLAAPTKAVDFSVSPSTPAENIVLGNSTEVQVAVFGLSELRGQNITVTRLTVLNCLVGGDDGDCTDAGDVPGDDTAVNSAAISYTDSTGATDTKTTYLVSGEAVFTGLDLVVPRWSTITVNLSVETNSVGSTGASSGAQFALVAKAFTPTDFVATTSRGLPLTGRNVRAAAEGNIMTIAKTKPTVSLASGSPSGVGIPGWNEVFRFDIAADSRGYVELDELLVGVMASDNAVSGWNSLASLGQDINWALFDIGDLSTPIEIDMDFYGSTELEYVQIYLEDEIAAGSTATYALYADTAGASAAMNDTIYTYLPDESEFGSLGFDTIHWIDDDTGADYDGEFVDSLPLYGEMISF